MNQYYWVKLSDVPPERWHISRTEGMEGLLHRLRETLMRTGKALEWMILE